MCFLCEGLRLTQMGAANTITGIALRSAVFVTARAVGTVANGENATDFNLIDSDEIRDAGR
jgi:hypothetical protein